MARKNRTPEENARREKIRELLQMANIGSMDDIQSLFKEAISEFMENGLEAELDDELGYSRYAAYGCIGHLYAVDILDMRFDITRGHALGVHGQNLFLNILTDAGLVLLQDPGLEFAFPITRYGHLHIAKAGPQCFAAVTIAAVVRVLVFVVILAVAEFIIQLCLQAVFHELGNGFLEQILNVHHTAYIAHLQQFPDF